MWVGLIVPSVDTRDGGGGGNGTATRRAVYTLPPSWWGKEKRGSVTFHEQLGGLGTT